MQNLRAFIHSCPYTFAILAGYSQGAEVIDIAYARLSDEERRHISSVTLFGDPRFNPNQPNIDQGDYSIFYQGIDIAVLGDLKSTVPVGWESRVHSYCTFGDPICNYDPRDLPVCVLLTKFTTCAHGLYYDRGYTEAAAVWARKMIAEVPRL